MSAQQPPVTEPEQGRSSSVPSFLTHHKNPWPMRLLGRIVSGIILIPVIATMLAALALMIYGAFETWHFLNGMFFDPTHRLTHDEVLLHAIELVDLFLLATVVQVVSLGLYQLYFDQDLDLPNWLRIRTLDDLKSKLVGVAVTVLAVYFLGRAITAGSDIGILYLGGASALVIAALTYFLSKIHDN
jgi:uncharacterized membrane protein YqhA